MTSPSISQVIDQERVQDLPLNGRDPTQLIFLSGAAVLSTYGDWVSSKNYPTSHATSVAGGQANGTAYLLDGGTAMDLFSGINLPLPFPDALQEFSVQTSTIAPQFGSKSGGVVNAVTKSGANKIHGDVFEFLRNGAVNARNFFAASTDTLKRNQFGGTVGGPIKADKLFYFGGYQGTRVRTAPGTSVFFVPNAAMLAGDFSTLESPTCGNSRTLVNPSTGQPFAGNYIDPKLFNSSALEVINKYIPLSSDPCGETLVGIPNLNSEDQYVGRVDWIASSRNSFFGRYFNATYHQPPYFNGNLLTSNRGVVDMVQTMTLGDAYTFSLSLLNSLHLTWSRDRIDRSLASNSPSSSDMGLNIAPAPATDTPQINVNGYFNEVCGTCEHARIRSNVAGEVADDLSWLHGRNQVGLGLNYSRRQMAYLFTTYQASIYDYYGEHTGDALPDFLLGLPDDFQQGNFEPYLGRENVLGLYAQDSFRASSHLTVTAGLRWDPYLPEHDINNEASHFDAAAFAAGQHSVKFINAPPGMLFPGDKLAGFGTIPNAGTSEHLPDFEPRLGFAWDPTGSGRWSLRASYGVFYDLPSMDRFDRYGVYPPWGDAIFISSPSGGFTNPYMGFPGGDPFPLPLPPPSNVFVPPGGTYMSFSLRVKVPITQHWNFSVQRQVGANWLLSAEYIGNGSYHRWENTELNPAVYIPGMCGANPCSTIANTEARRVLSLINPSAGALISTITYNDDGANAQYNGLLLKADHRLSQNFSVLANYTYSHCLSEAQNETELSGNDYQNPYDRNADRGNCVNDYR
jgi:hypothetical protein